MNKTLLGYVPEQSPIYAVHPFVKLFFLLVVSLFPMFIASPEWNLALMTSRKSIVPMISATRLCPALPLGAFTNDRSVASE